MVDLRKLPGLQYWMPNVGEANGTVRPKFRLEYLTYALPSLHPPSGAGEDEPEHQLKLNSGPDPEIASKKTPRFTYPVPLKQLPRSLRTPNATRTK